MEYKTASVMLNAWMEVVSPPSPSASQLFLYWEYIIKRKTRDIRKITPSPRAYFDRLLHLLGTILLWTVHSQSQRQPNWKLISQDNDTVHRHRQTLFNFFLSRLPPWMDLAELLCSPSSVSTGELPPSSVRPTTECELGTVLCYWGTQHDQLQSHQHYYGSSLGMTFWHTHNIARCLHNCIWELKVNGGGIN